MFRVLFFIVATAAAQPNIVLITLDATRADRMGFLGSRKALTPNLDNLARQGLVFERAYSQSPLTVESTATVLTGTYPQIHRASELAVPLAAAIPYLPDLLHGRGYRTAAFAGSALLDPQNGPFQAYDRGFDSYRHADRADQVLQQISTWINGNPRPFFVWVHLEGVRLPGAAYERTVRATDDAAGKLLTILRNRKLYDDALIVVAATEGESLGAHGEDTHGIFLYDETIHVPLLLKMPKAAAGKHVMALVRLLDVAPTILEIAGLPVPSQMQGQSLLRIAQSVSSTNQAAYARTDLPRWGFGASPLESWRVGKYLYIRAPSPELYDLSVDPDATRNLAQIARATLDTLAAQLQGFHANFGGSGTARGADLSSSEIQKLASLGYVGLRKPAGAGNSAVTGPEPKNMIAIANATLAALADVEDNSPQKAIPVLRQVLSTHPESYLAQYAMGAALVKEQKYPDAVEHLRKAIELQPDSARAHYLMGLSLVQTGQFAAAATHLEIASRRLPGFIALHLALADVYTRLGRVQDANRERGSAAQKP
jgi:choline-sulfatase